MILTITPNPSMDRTVEVPRFRAGGTFGARLVSLRPAGKGVLYDRIARRRSALALLSDVRPEGLRASRS